MSERIVAGLCPAQGLDTKKLKIRAELAVASCQPVQMMLVRRKLAEASRGRVAHFLHCAEGEREKRGRRQGLAGTSAGTFVAE